MVQFTKSSTVKRFVENLVIATSFLTFKNKLGEENKVWTPKNLQKEIDTEAEKTKPRSIYFCSLGQNKIQDGSGRVKNEYESCYK